jgi:microcystin-dependent protein
MENLKVESNIDIETNVSVMIPSGALLFIGGLTYATVNNQTWIDTNGLIPCDGRAVPRNDYPGLFNAIGTIWGIGNGSTTFNVPNLYSTRRFMTMPPVGTNISNTLAAVGHNHGNTSISNATGNLVPTAYDHSSHAGSFTMAEGGGHGDYFGGAYVNTSGASVNDRARPGNTSPVCTASHTHAMSMPAMGQNAGGGHGHNFTFNMGASSGTSHEHTFTTAVESVSSIIVEPQFVNALCFIKI